MSSLAPIGATLNVFQEHDKSPVVNRTDAGDVIERKGYIKKSRIKAYTDSLTFGTADGEFSNAVLTAVNSTPVSGDKAELTLTYSPVNTTYEVLPPVGTVIQEIDANAIDIPIAKNPNLTSQDIAQKKKKGVEAYIAPQPIYRRTEILSSFTFKEANAIDDVGKIDNSPKDLSTPTAGKWLKMGQTVRAVGDKFEQTETWQYASNGWDTDIYNSIA